MSPTPSSSEGWVTNTSESLQQSPGASSFVKNSHQAHSNFGNALSEDCMVRSNYGFPTGKGDQARPPQEALSTTLFREYVRKTCDDFVALRLGRGFLGENELIGGSALIGSTPVFALLYCKKEDSGNSCYSVPVSARLSGYRTAQHLMRLANKFNRPLVVFTTSHTSLQSACLTEPYDTQGFNSHIRSQCLLKVPIILVVLSRWSSADIFGAWLADKILALEQTRFSLVISDQEKSTYVQEVGARYLLHLGIINQTVPVASGEMYDSQVMMPKPKRLRAALSTLLEGMSHVSSKELANRREKKIKRLSKIASRAFCKLPRHGDSFNSELLASR